jgi:P-type Cu+ transporter
MSEQTVMVGGMTCAACVSRVEKVLRRVPGVEAAAVDLMTGRAVVRASDEVAYDALAAAISRAGYVPSAAPLPPDPVWPVCVALALSLPIAISMLGGMFGGKMLPGWAQLALAAPVQLWFGSGFVARGWKSLRNLSPSMDALVAIGTWAAFLLSLTNMFGPMRDMAPLYFDSAALVIALVMLGRLLEGRARLQAGAALRDLARLQPARVARVTGEGSEEVDLAALRVGDLVRIRPGERVPADGVVVEGRSEQDEAALTGESLPRAKGPGDAVLAGALNLSGLLTVRAEKIGAETALGRTVRLVEAAQGRKPPVQKLADRISAVFVPAVLAVALATLAGWLIEGARASTAIVDAVSVLVIACPCALGLATPAAIMAGAGAAARAGIVLRDPDALGVARHISTMVFDKTGTLTEGKPRLVACDPAPGVSRDEALRIAAALQSGSLHPLARAVLEAAPGVEAAQDVTDFPGRGIGGRVEGRDYRLGNAALMAEAGIDLSGHCEERSDAATQESTGRSADPWVAASPSAPRNDGQTVSYLAEIAPDHRLLASFAFADTMREGAAAAVRTLKSRGIRCVLLSGDTPQAVAAMAEALGLDEAMGGVLPAEKAACVAALRKQGKVAMVGDGVNDAPALAEADLGIAMAGGADLAAETAGIVLMRPDPRLAEAALDIAARTERRIWMGLAWAFGFNLIGIPLATLGHLEPALAGAAMAFSSLAVVTNALTLRGWKPRRSTA